jgi:hypothetical protein
LDHADNGSCDTVDDDVRARRKAWREHLERWVNERSISLPHGPVRAAVQSATTLGPSKENEHRTVSELVTARDREWKGPVFALSDSASVVIRAANGKQLGQETVAGTGGVAVPVPSGDSSRIAWIIVRVPGSPGVVADVPTALLVTRAR